MKQNDRTASFAKGMWDWFARHKRQLPWRDLQVDEQTQKAYMILVSEVMLQQTQVSRVKIIFKQFLDRFPTLQHLAAASNKDVIIAWRGMGYNSRALRLRDAAKAIIEQFNSTFPSSSESLLSIKGIGKYTAGAIRNFAFDEPTVCVDTNIERIMYRVFIGPDKEKLSTAEKTEIENLAGKSLKIALETPSSSSAARDWHAALMDFGSLVCTKRLPNCRACPFSENNICKSAFRITKNMHKKVEQKEPGRFIGGVFIPNRIIRGKVVDLLREKPQGLSIGDIGPLVCSDWSDEEHAVWLQAVLSGLQKSEIVTQSGERFVLKD